MDLKNKITLALKTHRYFIFMFFFFVFVYIYSSYGGEHPKPQEQLLTADTLIPKGYVLVPIELSNIDAIAGLIDHYGVVDIYLGKTLNSQSKKILQKVKILRAPLNPNSYAILLPDDLSKNFLNFQGPFVAVVQNRNTISEDHAVVKATPNVKTIKIEYNGG